MSRQSIEDRPLLPQSDSLSFDYEVDDKEDLGLSASVRPALRSRSRQDRILIIFLSISNVVLLICVGALAFRLSTSVQRRGPPAVYSPAQHLVEYENIVTSPLTAHTKYHGPPSPEVDKAWEDLYQMGVSSVPKSEAALIANRTLPYPDDPENYIVSLDVFHILHCLNNLRKHLWLDHYKDVDKIRFELLEDDDGNVVHFDHSDHCLNMIRENIQCHADLTPNVWKWDVRNNRSVVRFDTLHTCQKWEPIHQWAWEKTTHVKFNKTVLITDDLHFAEDPK